MATLTGQAINASYKDLLQVSNSNSGIDGTLRTVSDGEATNSVLQLSSSIVNINSATGLQFNGTTALTGGILKHEVGGLEFDASAVVAGDLIVGSGSGTFALQAGTFSSGLVTHEAGGLEFDASGVADGDIIVGDGAGSMALRVGALTAGAAGFLKHEVGGIEADISAITTDQFLGGTGAGAIGIRTAAQVRTSLGLVIGTNVQAWDAQLDDIAALTETKGNLIAQTGSAWANLAVGTDDQVLTADSGEATGIKWAAAATSGQLVLIETQVPTGDPQVVDFTTGIDSTYDTFVFHYSGLQCTVNDTEIHVLVGTSGPSYQATNYKWALDLVKSGGGSGNVVDNAGTFIPITDTGSSEGLGFAASDSLSGVLHLFEPHNTTTQTHVIFSGAYQNTGGNLNVIRGGGAWTTTTAVVAIRFAASAGAFDNVGRITLYGIKYS